MAAEEPVFCKDCPLRGRCKGEVVGIMTRPINGTRFGTGAFFATLAAVIDTERRVSEPLQIPASLTADEVVDAVIDCEGPIYVEKGIFRKRQVPQCRAIGQYACRDPQLYPIAKQLF